MTATTARDEEVWNEMFNARHVSRSLSTSALAILTAYRIEIERYCKPTESAPAPTDEKALREAADRAEQAESELKELTRICDESDEHQTWSAYYVSELERRLTSEQIAAARVALHERWQTVPHVDEQFSVVARIQQAEWAIHRFDDLVEYNGQIKARAEQAESALAASRKENERLRAAAFDCIPSNWLDNRERQGVVYGNK